MYFPKGTTEELESVELADLGLKRTDKKQENYVVTCQKTGKTQGFGLNRVPWEEVLAWCFREICQILSNGNKQGRKERKD